MGIRDLVKQAGQIVKAFSNPVPIDEEYFQHRIIICNDCEWNSANKDPEDLSFSDKLKIDGPFQGDPMCTACGCCVPRKAGLPESTCGLSNFNNPELPPKWTALKTYGLRQKSLSVENLSFDVGDISPIDGGFVYNTGKVTKDTKILKIKLNIQDTKGFKLVSIIPECGCTAAQQDVIDENSVSIGIDLSTVDFRVGAPIERTIHLSYLQKSSVEPKKVIITLKTEMI